MWRDFLINYFSQGLNFFPHLGDIKWCHTKVLHFFFIFFELVTPNLGPAWIQTRFRHSKNGKYTFRGTNQKLASVTFLSIPISKKALFLSFWFYLNFFFKIPNFLIFFLQNFNKYIYIRIHTHTHIHTYLHTYIYIYIYMHILTLHTYGLRGLIW
jgi:hypothetical protein